MNDINVLIEIIKQNGGSATIFEIANSYSSTYHAVITAGHRTTIQQVLSNNPELVVYDQNDGKWRIIESNFKMRKIEKADNDFLALRENYTDNQIKNAIKEYFEIDSNNCTLATYGSASCYWINSPSSVINEDWWLFLINKKKKELNVVKIPRGDINRNDLHSRNDAIKTDYFELKIRDDNDLSDIRSDILFSKWLFAKVNIAIVSSSIVTSELGKNLKKLYKTYFSNNKEIKYNESRREINYRNIQILPKKEGKFYVGFKNSVITKQENLDYVNRKYGVDVHYGSDYYPKITWDVSNCKKINRTGLSKLVYGYFVCEPLDEQDTVDLFNYLKSQL